MSVGRFVSLMEPEHEVAIWDVWTDDSAPIYRGAVEDIPDDVRDLEVTGVYPGEFFIGIDTD